MLLSTARLVLLFCAFFSTTNALGNQAPILKPDSARVAEGGNVIIDVLANDVDPDGTFNIGSMYILSLIHI